jgi:hypothetical protein
MDDAASWDALADDTSGGAVAAAAAVGDAAGGDAYNPVTPTTRHDWIAKQMRERCVVAAAGVAAGAVLDRGRVVASAPSCDVCMRDAYSRLRTCCTAYLLVPLACLRGCADRDSLRNDFQCVCLWERGTSLGRLPTSQSRRGCAIWWSPALICRSCMSWGEYGALVLLQRHVDR